MQLYLIPTCGQHVIARYQSSSSTAVGHILIPRYQLSMDKKVSCNFKKFTKKSKYPHKKGNYVSSPSRSVKSFTVGLNYDLYMTETAAAAATNSTSPDHRQTLTDCSTLLYTALLTLLCVGLTCTPPSPTPTPRTSTYIIPTQKINKKKSDYVVKMTSISDYQHNFPWQCPHLRESPATRPRETIKTILFIVLNCQHLYCQIQSPYPICGVWWRPTVSSSMLTRLCTYVQLEHNAAVQPSFYPLHPSTLMPNFGCF